jgi:hypothetical protein
MASAAPACKAALAQATARWPKRNKSSDGIMGDTAHQARVSDHNSGDAFDLTDDKAHGVDCSKIILDIVKDSRCEYAIHDRRIWERKTGKWRAYTGSNPHTGHMHVSIVKSKRGQTHGWKGIAPYATPPVVTPPVVTAPPVVTPPTATPTHVMCVVAEAKIHSTRFGISPTIGYMHKGNIALIRGKTANGSYPISFNGHKGWVAGKYVEPRP